MPQPRRQQRQLGLDVRASSVPTNEGIDCEAVPKVVDAWVAAFVLPDLGAVRQIIHVVPQPHAGVAAVATVATPQTRFDAKRGGLRGVTGEKQPLDLAGEIVWQREQSRLMELGSLDQERPLRWIVVTRRKAEQFAATHARGV